MSDATFRHRFKEAFSALAAQKPLLAATEAQRLTDRYQRAVALVATLETWSGEAPDQALSFLQNKVALQEFHHWSELWAALARGMARHDPNNALELISTNAPPVLQDLTLDNLTRTWAQSDPQEAADFALEHPELGPPMVQTIAEAWAKQDSDAALTWAHSLPDEQRRLAMKGLAGARRTEDPVKAFEAYAESADPHAGGTLIRLSASRDWQGTIDALSQWQDPRLRGHAAMTLFQYAYETSRPVKDDSGMLIDWIADAADDLRLFHHMAWALDEESIGYLETKHPALYQNAPPSLTDTYSRSNPAVAAELTSDIQEDGARKKHLVNVIQQWAARAPKEAAQWLHTQPHDDAREVGITALIDTWSRFDPAAAHQWESDQPSPVKH
ncbi:MAG: hypothetical protein ACI8T1_000500 [Verrucomicrobiales bacterium]